MNINVELTTELNADGTSDYCLKANGLYVTTINKDTGEVVFFGGSAVKGTDLQKGELALLRPLL